jgi:replication fork protection complex subunit Tof1/Swi1
MDIINLTDEEESNQGEPLDRRAILTPAIQRTIAALGGIEGGVYQLGDECYGCLKDLKKFWRKDDTDDERTVARIFWECRVLQNDLVPILLETAGNRAVPHKCAIAVADLLTAMTWPIDLAEELMELDEERDENTDYTTLIQAQLAYKAALLQPGVVKALIDIAIPYLAKDRRDRTERDGQLVNVILHLFRNLAFIKDLPPNTHLSSSQAELSLLAGKLITSDPSRATNNGLEQINHPNVRNSGPRSIPHNCIERP